MPQVVASTEIRAGFTHQVVRQVPAFGEISAHTLEHEVVELTIPAHIVGKSMIEGMWVLLTGKLSSLSKKEHFLRFQSQLMKLTAPRGVQKLVLGLRIDAAAAAALGNRICRTSGAIFDL